MRLSSRATLQLATLCCMIVGCATDDQISPCLTLEEVRRFGHDEVVREGLTDREIAAGGGVLGQIRGVLAGPDSTVFVLDRAWQKIVAFSPDRGVKRVILGGEGEGPGEFVTPVDIAETQNGFSVLDYELRRLSEFSWTGELIRTSTLKTRGPWRHLSRGDTVWIGYASVGPADDPAFYVSRWTGEPLEEGPLLEEEDRLFGIGVGMAFGPAGEILITTTRPGVWYSHEGTSWVRHGRPLFPNVLPPALEQVSPQEIRVTPAQYSAVGIATLGDSLVLQGVNWFDQPFDWSSPPGRDEVRSGLNVFALSGEHLARIELPGGVETAFLSTAMKSSRIFLTGLEPFPQVIEYRLRKCAVST